jgi:hypothetical protein
MSVASLAPSNPNFLSTASFDGTITILDIRSPEADTALAVRQRGPVAIVTGMPFWMGVLTPEDFCGVRYSSFRPVKWGTSLVIHEGAVWDIAASQGGRDAGCHPMILSAGSDGVCNLIAGGARLMGGHGVCPLVEVDVACFKEDSVSY